ncbi:MAG: UvrD-helicase domain-containing protein [Elusimicrobiota bacterium]
MKIENLLLQLNPEQKKAVAHEKGPLLIIAGAGTGKTTVIANRIAYLISKKKAKPEEILALTFTEKAAAEMQERVDVLVPYGFADVWISTFHSFGNRILDDESIFLGLTSDFKVMAQPQQIVFFKEHLFEFQMEKLRPLGNPQKHIEALLFLFSRLKDEDISCQEYADHVQSLNIAIKKEPKNSELLDNFIIQKEISQIYKKYEDLKMQYGLIDFSDQVWLALKLFRSYPSILKKYREKFKYILVDEFQDTNYSQFQLLKILLNRGKNITVVGDDDQCLPSDALIKTPNGDKKIRDIKPDTTVITAVGKGYTSTSKVLRVFKNRKKTRFLTITTEKNSRITVTDNHKMFCHSPSYVKNGKIYYVYLMCMCHKNLEWRIGVINDLSTCSRTEKFSNFIVGIKSFNSETEAKLYETLLSLKYQIPTVCFSVRQKTAIREKWLIALCQQIDTNKNAMRMAQDLRINLNYFHHYLDATTNEDSSRIKISIQMCSRKYKAKEKGFIADKYTQILHQVSMQTSNPDVIVKLRKSKINLFPVKKGVRICFASCDVKKVSEFADRLKKITNGIIETKFAVGTCYIQRKSALIMPAGNVMLGHFLPVIRNGRIFYEKVVAVEERWKDMVVYDLEIDKTHNFIANNVVVHNSIYKFRGAAISNILNFKKAYPKTKQVVLTKNYRSHQQILDSAYTLIKYNNPDRLEVKNGINKKLVAVDKLPVADCLTHDKSDRQLPVVQHHHFDTVSNEADFVAEKIIDLLKNGRKYSNIAILVRSNNDAMPFIKSFNIKNIPWHFSGRSGLYEREEIKILISFLKIVSNLSDNISLFHLSSSEIYKMPMVDLTILLSESSNKKIPLYNVFNKFDTKDIYPTIVGQITEDGKKIIKRITDDIKKYVELSRELSTGQILYKFISETGWLKELANLSIKQDSKNVEAVSNIALFFEIVKNYSEIGKTDKLQFFTSHLSAIIEAGSNPATAEVDSDTDAINILTIHKAKGLEFPVVFMVSLIQNKFPTRRRKECIEIPDSLVKDILPFGNFHIQEERRLFYVGMTRAKDKLYLTSACDYGGQREKKISQFVYEAINLVSTIQMKIVAKKLHPIEVIKKNEITESSSNILKVPISKQLMLSHFQIDDYLTCPLKYKYIHILKIPVMANHSIIYGNAMHETIQFYYKRKMDGKHVDLSELSKKFETNWQSSGFLSREHEEMRLENGRQTLRKFFQREQKSKIIPKYIEKKFKFIFGDDIITGRFDRVDLLGRVNNSLVEKGAVIIDFKTSDISDKDEADDRAQKSTQLAMYALAWKRITGKMPLRVELHFVDTGVIGSIVPDDKMIEKMEKTIEKVSEGIKNKNFVAVPRYLSCNYCPFNNVCSAKRNNS